jgi:hypothetical protein
MIDLCFVGLRHSLTKRASNARYLATQLKGVPLRCWLGAAGGDHPLSVRLVTRARGILDNILSMKPIHCVEFEPLPSSAAVEPESGEQRKHSILNL